PPQSGAVPAVTLEENAEHKEAKQPMTDQPVHDTEASQTEEPQTASPGEFALLAVGDTLIGRYEITQVLSENSEEHIYQAIDRQGYQHCWNCSSEDNTEGDEFCNDCGASMLNVPYILHEYPASTEKPAGDETVLNGSIVNIFMNQGRTYAVEQPLLNQSSFP